MTLAALSLHTLSRCRIGTTFCCALSIPSQEAFTVRICYICPDPGVPVLGRKGCSTHVRETCHALEQAGHQVLLLCANKGQDPQIRTNFHIVEVPPMRSKMAGYDVRLLQYNFRLAKAAERVVKKFIFCRWRGSLRITSSGDPNRSSVFRSRSSKRS